MRTHTRHGALALATLLAACGSDDTNDGNDAGVDVADAFDAAPETGDADYFTGGGYVLDDSHVNVIRQILFTGEIEPGVAYGFDLDGNDSPPGDDDSCGHGDLKGPDGETGIDNQFARVWGLIEALVGTQVQELLQGAINEGRVLIMVELEGVDDLQNDDDVTVNVYRTTLSPQIGTLGLIAPSQTYYFDYDAPVSTVENVAIVDGAFEAGPFEIQLPIQVLELDIVATMYDGRIRATIGEDGAMDGVIGGAFDVPEIITAIEATPAAAEAQLVRPFFENNADIGPTSERGDCRYLSLAFLLDGTNAYVVRDATQE